MYVVVNTSANRPMALGQDWYPVMPGEDPHVHLTLKDAAECVALLAIEYDHDLESARIFRLVPVAPEEILPVFEAALAAAREEYGELYGE